MVAYLKKPEGSEGFHQIVDFLNASHIRAQFFRPRSPTQSPIADEAASTGVNVRYERATTTITGLEAGHGSGNIDKTPTMPHDLPLLRVNTLGSDEGSMTLQELMVFCITLSKNVESLETNLKQTKLTYGAAYTKLIKKEELTVLCTKLSTKVDNLEADLKQTKQIYGAAFYQLIKKSRIRGIVKSSQARRKARIVDKGKAIMEEAETVQTKTKLQLEQERLGYEEALRLLAKTYEEERQRIARVQEEASSFNIEEWDDIQARVEANEEFA
ncbi:hypothetical protein Tco_1242959 [Tanacetum coccineum]